MAGGYPPRKYAPGHARRDFRKYRREEIDPVTGAVKKVVVPASYWQQSEDMIPLEDLPVFWEHNNTQFTDKWRRDFNQRLCDDYIRLVCEGDPEVSPYQSATYDGFVKEKEAFFDAVSAIENWPFWKYTKQTSFRNYKLVSDKFKDYCPEYEDYLDFKSTRYAKEHLGTEYAQWRRSYLAKAKFGVKPYEISGVSSYQYQDEKFQLGDIEMQHDNPNPEDTRISIYEYVAGQKNLVPTPGMPELDELRRDMADKTGIQVDADVFIRAVAEHASRQAEIETARAAEPADKPKSKSLRELEMDDLNRLVADLKQSGQALKERSDGAYGW